MKGAPWGGRCGRALLSRLMGFRLTDFRLTGFIAVAALAAGLSCGHQVQEEAHSLVVPAPRVVVFIVIDTLRTDYVGAYGARRGLTPNIDAIASEGFLFENAIATSSWTRSSIASMLTSRYPTAIGVLGRADAIASEVDTLAEALRSQGFRTLGVTTNSNAGKSFGFAQGFERFVVPDLTAGYSDGSQVHTAEGVTRKALEMIDELPGGEPLFLYLHYVDPHDPYLPHPDRSDKAEPPGRFDGSREQLALMDRIPRADLSAADIARIEHLYAGEIAYCDHWIGELMKGLKARGLHDEMFLTITSDHGEGLWDHGVRDHGRDLYEEMTRVPLVVWFPNAPDAGRVISTPVSLVDIAPTIMSALALPAPPAFDGLDLTAAMAGASQLERAIYSELDLNGVGLESVRSGDMKLIRDRKRVPREDFVELYDLSQDPHERNSLANASTAARATLEAELGEWLAVQTANAIQTDHINLSALDQDTLQNLQALGYMDGYMDAPVDDSTGPQSVLDFTRSDAGEDQLLEGFYAHERDRRWMAGRASVVLGRRHAEQTWRLTGWIDLALHERETLSLSVGVDGSEPVTRRVEDSGFFLFEGELPADSTDVVRLDLECDHDFVPASRGNQLDRRALCIVVQSVGLY